MNLKKVIGKVTGEKLFFDNREVSIKGAVLIFAAFSPSGKYVAILSADGPRKGRHQNASGAQE